MQSSSVLSDPRGYVATALKATFVMAIPFGIFLSLLGSLVFGEPVRRTLLPGISADSEVSFLRRLDIAAAEIGFFPATRAPGFYTYRTSFLANQIGGRVALAIGDGKTTIAGPRGCVRYLVKALSA